MLKIKNCSKSFKKTKALNDFSCDFEEGVYGLLGPNGSGKTTLMRCICGLYPYESGTIECDCQNIGYLPQNFGMFKPLTVYEMMSYFSVLKKIPKEKEQEEIEKAIELVNLSDKLNSKVGSLSGGMVRRAGIAQAIMGNPSVILFDEPTAGLDPEERIRFKTLLSKIKTGKTIILSTHIVSDVEAVCDNIVIIDKGKKIFSGTHTQVSTMGKDKTFLVEEKYQSKLSGSFYIKDKIERDGKDYLCILTDRPFENMIQIDPTIEDGYLCALKRI